VRFPFPFFDVITIPSDAGPGDPRIVINGPAGTIEFYNANGDLVGLLSPDVWYTGIDGQAQAQMDPFGGFRVFNDTGNLAGIFSAVAGLQLYNPDSGVVSANLIDGRLVLTTDDGTVEIGILGGEPILTPYRGTSSLSPGATITTPLYAGPAVADGVDVRHVAAFKDNTTGTLTWTAPAGYTERSDTNDNASGCALATSVATRDTATGGVQTFTNGASDWDVDTGTTILVRGIGGAAAYRSISTGAVTVTTDTNIPLSLAPPVGTALDDVLLAFVTLAVDAQTAAGASLPTSWSVPDGWMFLGATFQIVGVGIAQQVLATGCWAKTATGSEPATYDITVIVPGTTSIKKIHPVIVAVEGADTQTSGPDIQINNRSIGRGIVAQQEQQANSAGISVDGLTDFALSNVSVIAGRTYAVHLHSRYTISALGEWALELMLNGTKIGEVGYVSESAATADITDGIAYWTPTVTATTDDLTVNANELAGASTLTFIAAANTPRWLTLTDLGVL
jgi:hypothetical protein